MFGFLEASRAHASVTVFHNPTSETVRFTVHPNGRSPRTLVLAPDDSRAVGWTSKLKVRLSDGAQTPEVEVSADFAYDVIRRDPTRDLALQAIPLGPSIPIPVVAHHATLDHVEQAEAASIGVKIFVDDDELRRRLVWERTLRERIAAASEVLRVHAGVGLRVVETGTWDSDDRQLDFNDSLREFEQEATLGEAQVAIGFTSQYQVYEGRFHMGGTRGPLHSHILIKERARGVLETERLELLVHELGHFLGASHSAEPGSVMRPLLDRGRQRAAGARLRFDAANTLLIAMMGEQIRFRRVTTMEDLPPSTRRRMSAICQAIERQLPEDPAATQIRMLLSAANATQIVDDTNHVLQAIVKSAELENARGVALDGLPPADSSDGDKLLEVYVRQAARATREIERETSRQALLLALGIALDDTDTLRTNPVSRGLVERVEDPSARARRLAVMGRPTMLGRADLAKHFFVSAHATVLVGRGAAVGVGLAKEAQDSRGGSGFSFVDIQANLAGVKFAEALTRGQLTLESLEKEFRVDAFLPPLEGLPEGLDAAAFADEFGGIGDRRTVDAIKQIEAAISALPGYRNK